MVSKVTKGVSDLEREQMHRLNRVNDYEDGSITPNEWYSFSICAIVAHLVECSDKEEVQTCLDMIEVIPQDFKRLH